MYVCIAPKMPLNIPVISLSPTLFLFLSLLFFRTHIHDGHIIHTYIYYIFTYIRIYILYIYIWLNTGPVYCRPWAQPLFGGKESKVTLGQQLTADYKLSVFVRPCFLRTLTTDQQLTADCGLQLDCWHYKLTVEHQRACLCTTPVLLSYLG
jgi:hypothetical protein